MKHKLKRTSERDNFYLSLNKNAHTEGIKTVSDETQD